MCTKPELPSRLSSNFRYVLNKKFNILGEFDIVNYDHDFNLLQSRLLIFSSHTFSHADKFIIVHYDTDYYMPNSNYGLSIYNLYKTFLELDISLSTMIIVTNHKGIESDFKNLIPFHEQKYNFPIIIDNYISAFRESERLTHRLSDINFTTNISHHAICMMGAKRIHRNILFNEFKKNNLLNEIICAYNNL